MMPNRSLNIKIKKYNSILYDNMTTNFYKGSLNGRINGSPSKQRGPSKNIRCFKSRFGNNQQFLDEDH